MASIEKYELSNGLTRYAVRYRKPDRSTTMKRGFATKKSAEAFANSVEVSKLAGTYVAPSLGRITAAELAPGWLARKKESTAPSHYRTLESAWRVHVEPRWGSLPISAIDQLSIEDWVASMTRRGAGPTTVLRAFGVLSGVLNDAVKAKRLANNPAKGVESLPRKTARRHIYLTAADVRRLAEESGQHRPLVLTLAYCGLRWGEAIALRITDVDFFRRRLSISENAVQIGARHALGPTKGRKARSVPVPEFVLQELYPLCQEKDPADLLFPGRGGSYLHRPKAKTGWFQAAVHRASIQRITPHDLRHTCASLAVSAGVNVLALQRMLGHTSAKVTLDTYADLFDTDLDAVAASLHAAYSQTTVLETRSRGAQHDALGPAY